MKTDPSNFGKTNCHRIGVMHKQQNKVFVTTLFAGFYMNCVSPVLTPGLKLLGGIPGGDLRGVNQQSVTAKKQTFSVQFKGWCLPRMLRLVVSGQVHFCLLPLSHVVPVSFEYSCSQG